MSTEKTLQVSIPESNSQLIKVVRAFIRKRYHLVEDDQAEVCIIDFDTYQAKSLMDNLRHQYPDRPIISLSVDDHQDDNLIHVKKPFRQDDLIQALAQARNMLVSTKNRGWERKRGLHPSGRKCCER